MGSLFKMPDAPEPKPPARMPDPDDPSIIEAKRREQAQRLSRGRSSTILSTRKGAGDGSFDSYASDKL